jgi:hypothetical protein
MLRYMETGNEGVLAFQARDFRLSADKYMEAILNAPNGVWTENRLLMFHGYTSILNEKYFTPAKNDCKTLRKKFVDNENEPTVY